MSTVLVLEDDRATQEILADALAVEGYTPIVVSAVDEALAALERQRVAVVITDVPGVPAHRVELGFVRHLEARQPGVPIILCSARGGIAELVPSEHGLYAIVPKPFDLLNLLAIVGRAASSSE